MSLSDYLSALGPRQRLGLLTGVAAIAALTVGSALWLLRDPYVPLVSGLDGDQLHELVQELDKEKVSYRVADSGDGILIARSELGRARAAATQGHFGAPPSVGLELFKDTDFSTTDFAQRINYQRALQGELTRTIQTIAGVRSARVHVILADAGLFKRDAAKASAAVSVALQPQKSLTPAQVRGIQRLVAASVPEIKLQDVVVLDESGLSLTRSAGDAESDAASGQLDLKRQADEYLASKLTRLLQDAVPRGVASLSVDAVLDERQLRVTTDEPIGGHKKKDGDQETGVLVKERESQHGHGVATGQSDADSDDAGSDREYEYQVGHRMEQVLSNAGSIKRLGVAVVLQGAPAELSAEAVEQLVASAVGLDRSRGDSVTVLLLPPAASAPVATPGVNTEPGANATVRANATVGTTVGHVVAATAPQPSHNLMSAAVIDGSAKYLIDAAAAAVVLALLLVVTRRRSRPKVVAALPGPDTDVDAVTLRVRQWLTEGASDGRI